jgi:hypothetical protein
MLERLRSNLFLKSLRHIVANQARKRVFHSFDSARSVGLLFDATDERLRREVLDFAAACRKKGQQVRLLGFWNAPQATETGFDAFTAKELSFAGQPKSEKALTFGRTALDLLICFNFHQHKALEWLAASSPAAMKIGVATDQPNDYDLQLEIPAEKRASFFVEQLRHYLNKFTLTAHAPVPAI